MRSREIFGWSGFAALLAGVAVVALLPPGSLAWSVAALVALLALGMGVAMQVLHRRFLTVEGQASEMRLRMALVMEAVPGGFALCDREERLSLVNSRFRDVFPDLALEGKLGELLPDLVATVEEGIDHQLADGRWYRITRHVLPQGGSTLVAIDVTPLKRREEELLAREARQRVVLEMAPVGIWELDAEGKTVFANPQTGLLLGGRVPGSLSEAGLYPVVAGRPTAEVLRQQPQQRGALEVECDPGGEGPPRRMLLASSVPLPAAPPALPSLPLSHTRILTLLDITERRVAQAEAERLAWQDPLTSLGNRALFQRMLEERLEVGGVTLLFIELGGLGRLNERYGHALGDALLIASAARLTQAVRADDAVFRLGGNKFAVLATGLETKAATWLAERLHQLLLDTFRHDGLEVGLSPAVGVARSPPVAADADALRRAAELARQRSAKEDRVILYEDALGDEAEHKHRIRDAVTRAIAAGEFRLDWQPQFDAGERRLVGAEALLRWHSAALGREVPPSELFPAAADVGLLEEIDLWVLEEALATKSRWAGRHDAPPVVAINVSAASLREPGFAEMVMEAMGRHDVPPDELEIEIPEDVPARDLGALAQTLDALCSHGVRLSLDDFGGGASSMAHLVQLPVNRVKLDRSIVRGLPAGARESAVLRAVAAVARSLNIELLGEGVEKIEQIFALRGQGCTVVQGFLYGRPVPADELVPPLANSDDRVIP